MYSIGLSTALLYIASVASFLLGVQYKDYFKTAFILGGALFVIASVALLLMMRKRMEKQNF